MIKRQLEETRTLLEAEQQKIDISSTTAAKHAELINKVMIFIIQTANVSFPELYNSYFLFFSILHVRILEPWYYLIMHSDEFTFYKYKNTSKNLRMNLIISRIE